MALLPSFTAIQVYATPSILRLTDTSTGSDILITERRVYLVKHDGTYLIPSGNTTNYIVWDYTDSTIDIDVLGLDYCLDAIVDWVDVLFVPLYTDSLLKNFDYICRNAYAQLSLQQALNNYYFADKDYFEFKSAFKVCIDDAKNAVDIGTDIMAAQYSLDRANYFVTNNQFFF